MAKLMIPKIGDSLKRVGDSSDFFSEGKSYEIHSVGRDEVIVIDDQNESHSLSFGFIPEHFELITKGSDIMSESTTQLKKGVFVRYVGGDPCDDGDLTIGKIYEVEGLDIDRDAYIRNDCGHAWFVFEDMNEDSFVKVFGELADEPVISDYEKKAQEFGGDSLSAIYPKYYKDVSNVKSIDVYMTHKLFEIDDPSGAIQHASKKLLLSGVRTGGKSKYDDIKEARDTLNRWLEIYAEEDTE